MTANVTVSYDEGNPVPVSTSTNVDVGATMVGDITPTLPADTFFNVNFPTTYPVSFNFQNVSSVQAATNVKVATVIPQGFVVETNDCTGTIPPLGTCAVTGSYTPKVFGTVNLGATLSYAEGADVPLSVTTTAVYLVYIANYAANQVLVCSVNTQTGAVSGCRNVGFSFGRPNGIALDKAGLHAYIANSSSAAISLCNIDAANSGAFSGCQLLAVVFLFLLPWFSIQQVQSFMRLIKQQVP